MHICQRICHNGHEVIEETDKTLKKEYKYYCPTCDENMYEFETEIKIDEPRNLQIKI